MLPFGLSLGGSGLTVQIELDEPPADSEKIVAIDVPSWKVRKNPYAHALKQASEGGGGMGEMKLKSAGASSQTAAVGSRLFAYEASQNIQGNITLSLPYGKRVDHLGIKVEFVGRIDMGPMASHDGRPHYDFISLCKELAPPGSIFAPSVRFPFIFKNVEKPYETYHGRNVSVRYIIRVAIERKFLPPIIGEKEVIVQNLEEEPEINEPIKMEVGIEDCLHIEFQYEKKCYHLKDVIEGKIHFLLVKIKIKYMELAVIRRETCGENIAAITAPPSSDPKSVAQSASMAAVAQGSNIQTESQTLTKHEIMDGAPVKGEVVPVKLFLAGLPADLTPTYTAQQNNRFSVKYFLNLVLVDEEDRRYFKQQEIILWRKQLGS